MKTTVTLQEKMHFIGEVEGHTIDIDTSERGGGENRGMSPKQLTLTSLAGCTAMDVISILRKMRAEPESLVVEAETDVTEGYPKVFTGITLTYRVKGKNVKREQVERAVGLSHDTYCGVNAMLEKAVSIEWKIVMED